MKKRRFRQSDKARRLCQIAKIMGPDSMLRIAFEGSDML